MKILKIALISLCVPVLLGIGLPSCRQEPPKPPNIILISIDTWRNDYFTPKHMPTLYDFADENCMVYTNAHANSTWTKPSHLTMLTGLLQSEHGVEYDDSAIPATLTMVQHKLKDAGYTTAAFVGGAFVSREWGFARGFDKFWQPPSSPKNKPRRKGRTFGQKYRGKMAPFDKAERYISTDPGQPLFLFVHSYQVHEYWNLYFPEDRIINEVAKELRQDERFAELERPTLGKFMNDATPDEMRRPYAKAVLDCDKRLSQFLSALKQSPIFSNAKIIITSDHGEGLGDIHEEHISKLHAQSPYSEQTHVPLIVYGEGIGKIDRLVGVDDIAGTILKFAGIEKEPKKSLSRKRDFIVSEYVPLNEKTSSRAVAVISDNEKFLLAEDGNLRLFQDAQDRKDLIVSPASPFVGWTAIEGLFIEEGPYPQWNTPVVRWAHGPRTTLKFLGDGQSAQLILGFSRNNHQDQTMSISLNGEHLDDFELGPEYRFHHLQKPLQTREGENTLVFEYSRMQGERELTVCFEKIMIVPEPINPRLQEKLRRQDAVEYPFKGWDDISGLGPKSGPYPQWDLPAIRWGMGPRTEFTFESDGEPLALSMTCSPYHVPKQELTILLNGEQAFRRKFDNSGKFEDIAISINPKVGANRMTFEYRTWDKTDPEFAAALLFKRLRIVPPELSILSDSAGEGP